MQTAEQTTVVHAKVIGAIRQPYTKNTEPAGSEKKKKKKDKKKDKKTLGVV